MNHDSYLALVYNSDFKKALAGELAIYRSKIAGVGV